MAVDVTQMEKLFNDVLDAYFSAEHTRLGNFPRYSLNDLVIKKRVTKIKDDFALAKAANNIAQMRTLFDLALQEFSTAEHLRNWSKASMYVEAEQVRKEREARFRKLFDKVSL